MCGGGSGSSSCGGLQQSGTSDVTEIDFRGHLDGDAGCKGRDLLMYVHEEGFGFPAALFLDGFSGDPIEMHGHGSSRSEGVAADIATVIAEVKQSNFFGSRLEGFVDLLLVNVLAAGSRAGVVGEKR